MRPALLLCAFAALALACGGIPTSTAPKASPRKADGDLQAKREKLIKDLQGRGLFGKVETPGDVPHLHVKPAFMALDFDQKKQFVSVVCAWAYELPKEPTAADLAGRTCLVRIFSVSSGKEVGTYTPELGLSMN